MDGWLAGVVELIGCSFVRSIVGQMIIIHSLVEGLFARELYRNKPMIGRL